MLRRFFLLIPLTFCLLAACERMDFTPKEVSPIKPEEIGGGNTPAPQAGSISISEAKRLLANGADTIVSVRGYIVGVVAGINISTAQFEGPFSNESNLLLSSFKSETNGSNCFPVRLVKGSKIKDSLNLPAHPELHLKAIILSGKLEKYYGICGIKDILSYEWIDDRGGSIFANDTIAILPISQQDAPITGGR